MYGVSIEPNPLLDIVGTRPESIVFKDGMYKVIAFTTLLARCLILLYWKSADPPT